MRHQFSIDVAASAIRRSADRRRAAVNKPSHAVHYVWAACFLAAAVAFWTVQQALDGTSPPITNIGGGVPNLEILAQPKPGGLNAVRIVAVRKRGECMLRETMASIASNGVASTAIDLDPPKWRQEPGPLSGTLHMNGALTIPQLPPGSYELCTVLRWQCGPGWLPSLKQHINCATFSLP